MCVCIIVTFTTMLFFRENIRNMFVWRQYPNESHSKERNFLPSGGCSNLEHRDSLVAAGMQGAVCGLATRQNFWGAGFWVAGMSQVDVHPERCGVSELSLPLDVPKTASLQSIVNELSACGYFRAMLPFGVCGRD